MISRTPPPNSELTVAILAGGLGTRLRAVVSDKPKVLAPVGGRPFLAWWLDALEAQGFRKVILCTGYMAAQVEAAFGGRHGQLELRYSTEDTPLGTGGALHKAIQLYHPNPLLVLNGDSFCHQDLRPFVQHHFERHASASLMVTQVDDVSRYGSVEIAPDGLVKAFREKTGRSGPGSINAGIYVFGRELFQVLPSHVTISLERDLLPQWISRGIRTFQTSGRFIDIGTPESLAAATDFFTGPQLAAA